jgi:3-deoxy-7-phosphoheptulonate synthase
MPMRTRDLRVTGYRPLVPPAILLEELPLSEEGSRAVARARAELLAIIDGEDDRLVAIFGPCSIHDPVAALDYARRLRAIGDELSADLVVVMRAYFMKPRTSVGWKGLVSDPHRDGSFRINDGLRMTRRLLLDLVEIGVPAACEFVDPISPQYTSDLVAWAAIGARTTESQVHRELASGLSFPVGFKNGTDGNVQIAIDAVRAASQPHSFMGVTEQGLAAIVETGGNPSSHVVLRGGTSGTNHDAASVQRTLASLRAAGSSERLMIDLSHGNSGRDHLRQPVIAHEVAAQIASGERGIVGVMAESFIEDGRQDDDAVPLVYGKSITDPCLGWDRSVEVLRSLADAVRARRSTPANGRTRPSARSADSRTRAPSRS